MKTVKTKNEVKAPSAKRRRNVTRTLLEDSEEENFPSNNQDEEDCACIYCNDLYLRSRPGEDWLRCLNSSL